MNRLLYAGVSILLIVAASIFPKGFTVDGTKLIDANGNEFVMRGVNFAFAWYMDKINESIPAIAKAGANTVRIVLSNGVQWTKTTSQQVTNLLNACNEHKMIAVLEVHDATGRDSKQDLISAANYFVEIKSVLTGKEDRVIINIANEWYGSWNTDPWADGYKDAIVVIRNAGMKHTIMIDCAGYGQYPQSIHSKGKDVFGYDQLGNTMFSIHMYEYSGSDAQTIKRNIDNVLSQGLALCIGEFGFRHTSGDVDEQYILDYCQEKGVGWLAWSWCGNGGGVEYLDLANNHAGTSLSDWGNTVVNGKNGLKQTSRVCTIFGSTRTVKPMVSVISNNRNMYQVYDLHGRVIQRSFLLNKTVPSGKLCSIGVSVLGGTDGAKLYQNRKILNIN
jgi:mannan endo-1,4-beta-mannosidase